MRLALQAVDDAEHARIRTAHRDQRAHARGARGDAVGIVEQRAPDHRATDRYDAADGHRDVVQAVLGCFLVAPIGLGGRRRRARHHATPEGGPGGRVRSGLTRAGCAAWLCGAGGATGSAPAGWLEPQSASGSLSAPSSSRRRSTAPGAAFCEPEVACGAGALGSTAAASACRGASGVAGSGSLAGSGRPQERRDARVLESIGTPCDPVAAEPGPPLAGPRSCGASIVARSGPPGIADAASCGRAMRAWPVCKLPGSSGCSSVFLPNDVANGFDRIMNRRCRLRGGPYPVEVKGRQIPPDPHPA